MDGRLHLASIQRVSAARSWVVCAMHLNHFPTIILHHRFRGNEIAVTQPYLTPGRETIVFLGWVLAKIILLDVEHLGKWNGALAGAFVLGIIDCLHFFYLTF